MSSDEQLNLFDLLAGEKAADSAPDFDAIPKDAKVPIPAGTYQDMQEMAAHCDRCFRCGLGKTRTHAVVGRGSLTAPIMIIGEGPGQNEDEQGLPFVGKAGQLLEKILKAVNLDSENDVYICNAVKCLDGKTPVLTKAGWKTISQIVKQKWAGEVLSVDGDEKLVWRRVTGWYKSPLAGRSLYKVSLKNNPHASYIATADHPVLTQRGWLPVEELQAKDLAASGMPAPEVKAKQGAFERIEGFSTHWQQVTKQLLPPQPERAVYCIDVENTANFVTPAGAVHNCRPPGNRVPEPEEIEACNPYLLEQIRLVDPKIILLTGATAVRALTGDKRGITKIRGTWINWQGRLCMPIFHPAYLLRNPDREPGSPKWLMWKDIQTVRAKLDEIRS